MDTRARPVPQRANCAPATVLPLRMSHRPLLRRHQAALRMSPAQVANQDMPYQQRKLVFLARWLAKTVWFAMHQLRRNVFNARLVSWFLMMGLAKTVESRIAINAIKAATATIRIMIIVPVFHATVAIF